MRRVERWIPRCFGAVLVGVASLGAAAQQAAPSGFEVFLREAVARAHEAVAVLAADAGEAAQRARFEALLLTAGRPTPPGLAALRSSEREAGRKAALDELRPWIATPAGRARLDALLDAPEEPRRWCAAARVATDLGLIELAPVIGSGLDAERAPRTRAAARRALFGLTRRWFPDAGSFRAFWTREGQSACTSFFLEPLDQALRESRERLLRWLAHEPASALAWLDDPDPETRRAVAGVVGAAIGAGRLEPRDGVRALLDRAAVEADPTVFHALVDQVLAPLIGELPDAEPVVRLRSILRERLDSGPDGFEVSIAHALARLPWRTTAGADGASDGNAHVEHGLDAVATLLEGLDGDGSFEDPDVRVACLQELAILADLARGAVSATGPVASESSARARTRAVVVRWLTDAEQVPGVRIAAARVVATFATPADVATLSSVFARADSSLDLRFAILGSLSRIGPTLDPDGPIAAELTRRLQAIFADPDPELRRRALTLFGDEAWQPLAALLDVDALVARLDREPADELRRLLFERIASHGRAEHVGALLAGERFAEFVTAEPARPGWVARKLAPLCADDGALLVDLAVRIEAIDDAATRAERLAAALAALARLDDDAARALSGEDHRRAVLWALQLRKFGVRLPASSEGGATFLRRLFDVHVVECADVEEGAGPCLYARAIFGSELAQLEGSIERADLEALFESALQYAAAHADDADAIDPRAIHRDRARMRAALQDADGALADYRAVGDADELLGTSDLRLVAGLLDEPPADATPEVETARAAEACAWTWRLIEREEWRAEPASTRRADLAALVERALRSTDGDWTARVAELLTSCPAQAPPVDGDGGLWSGLVGDEGFADELGFWVARIDTARAIETTETPPPVPPEPGDPAEGLEAPGSADRGGTAPTSGKRSPGA